MVSILEETQVQTQENEVRRGRRAEALLGDPLVVEAFETLDRAFYQAFRDISPADHAGLAHLRLLVKCLEEFQGFFTMAVETGKLTQQAVKLALQEEDDLEKLERQRLRR